MSGGIPRPSVVLSRHAVQDMEGSKRAGRGGQGGNHTSEARDLLGAVVILVSDMWFWLCFRCVFHRHGFIGMFRRYVS